MRCLIILAFLSVSCRDEVEVRAKAETEKTADVAPQVEADNQGDSITQEELDSPYKCFITQSRAEPAPGC